ncbi:MAG: homocysteine S-methyltransferase family protein [bacterium]|nr:homocysteine S-methyltransferase family protein [bacterium]
MSELISDRISRGKPLLFDGAIGSRLIALGLPPGSAPEAWLLTHPEHIADVHRDYVQAGSDVISTCSFGGNRYRLQKLGLEDHIKEINHLAVELAREAASEKTYVAADMGPTGEFFQPFGKLTLESARNIFIEQAELLAQERIDLFLLETHYDLKEAEICLQACQEVAPDIPVGVSLTFNRTPKGFFTVMGQPAEAALKSLSAHGAFLVGSNCTLDALGMLELAEQLLPAIKTPLLFQPNAGTPQLTPDGVVYPQSAEEFCGCIARILKLGARSVGGCCGTDASHIKALRRMIDEAVVQGSIGV